MSYDVLLLHFDGTDGSTTITDSESTPKSVTVVGTAHLSTADKKFGTASLLLDGNSDYVQTADSNDWFFDTADFTIDTWVKLVNHTQNHGICGQEYSSDDNWAVYIRWWSNVVSLNFDLWVGGHRLVQYHWDANVLKNLDGVKTHISVCRHGSTMYAFINGSPLTIISSTAFGSQSFNNQSSQLTIGMSAPSANWYYLYGNMDEFRISKGIARHIAAFTPPTAAYNLAPLVSTQDASSIEQTDFVANGTIDDVDNTDVTRRGFCYKVGVSGDPTTGDSVAYDDGTFSAGAYTKAITGLVLNAGYRVRAYAINSAGTSYGATVQVTTLGPTALSFADSLTLSDSMTKNIELAKADAVTVTDQFSRSVAFIRHFDDTMTLTDVIAKLYEKNTADAVTLADSLSKVANYRRTFADDLSLADHFNIAKPGQYFLSFSETLTLVDEISKQITMSEADVLSLVDELSMATTFNRAFSDSLTLSDSLTMSTITLLTLTILTNPVTVGTQQQVSVMGLFSDGSVQNVTSRCQFVSSDTSKATIDSAGLITGIATGLTIITATIGIVTTNYTLAVLPSILRTVPQTGIVAFADGSSYRNATYLSRRYEFLTNSIGWIKVLASKYPVMVDLIYPDIPYTISVIVTSKKPVRVKSFLMQTIEVRVNPLEEVSAVFLSSSLGEIPV